MTRPDDRAQLEYLIDQGYHIHACCPPEHHDIDTKCGEKSSGKIPYDLDKRCHLSKWESAPGFTVEQLGRVWKIKPQPNIGLRLGNGIVRLDIDSMKGEMHVAQHGLLLPESWEFTSGRGRGVLYHVPENTACTKKIPYEDVEVLGDGQQSVIPPSKHRRGTTYEWREGHAPTEIALAAAPDWILNLMETKTDRTTPVKAPIQNDASHFWSLTIEEVLGAHTSNFPSPFHDSEGGANSSVGEGVHTCWRHHVCHTPLEALAILSGVMGTDGNDACFRAGKELQGGKASEVDFTHENIETMWTFAKKNQIVPEDDPHPFGDEHPKRKKGKKVAAATRLVELTTATDNIELFVDERNHCCVAYDVKTHREIHKIDSEIFTDHLTRLLLTAEGEPPSKQAIDTCCSILRSMARSEGKTIRLELRVALHDGAIWYDLADAKWRAVRISAEGWEIVDRPPILFRRSPPMRAQVTPERGGSLDDFFALHNLPEGEQEQLLYKVEQFGALIPDIPWVLEILHGDQGSIKTGGQKLTKKLFDPCKPLTASFPDDMDELILLIDHHRLLVLDNVSGKLHRWQSDTLSRTITGEGYEKRKLYKDEDAIIIDFIRPIMMNGINIVAALPDLLDRSAIHKLRVMPKKSRKKAATIEEAVNKIAPGALGAAFDIVSKAMRIKPGVRIAEFERMADFCEWGEALARAMGYAEGKFMEAYIANRVGMNVETLSMNPVGTALTTMLEREICFVGTASELLHKLTEEAVKLKIDVKDKGWPKGAHILSRSMNEILVNVEAEGYKVDCMPLDGAQKDPKFKKVFPELAVLTCSRSTKVYYVRSANDDQSDSVRPGQQALDFATKLEELKKEYDAGAEIDALVSKYPETLVQHALDRGMITRIPRRDGKNEGKGGKSSDAEVNPSERPSSAASSAATGQTDESGDRAKSSAASSAATGQTDRKGEIAALQRFDSLHRGGGEGEGGCEGGGEGDTEAPYPFKRCREGEPDTCSATEQSSVAEASSAAPTFSEKRSALTDEEKGGMEEEDAALRTELARISEKYVEGEILDYMITELLKGKVTGDKVSPFILKQIAQVQFRERDNGADVVKGIVDSGYSELDAVAERIHKLKKRKAGKEAPR